jgi:hypothetical protein
VKQSLESYLLDPPKGSKAAAAKEFGIDLTLLIGTLNSTPEQRIIDLQQAMRDLHHIGLAGERWRQQQRDRTRTGSEIPN